jgi:mono/diheme cytochrome c family protein
MPKFFSVFLAAALSSTALLGITPPNEPKIKDVPIQQTSPTSGKQMYATYCAACHGAEGKGNGPAAPALKTPPTDLTTLAQRNGGNFPEDRVIAELRFGVPIVAHGTAEMPIWGDLMLTISPATSPDNQMLMRERIHNLSDYLKTMQVK